MEILIHDIPDTGLEFIFDASKDMWFRRALVEALGGVFDDRARATLDLRLERFENEVEINGMFDISSHPACDRCLKHYDYQVSFPFHAHMTPLYESERQRERERDEEAELELVKDDLEFSYYEGDRIHLDELVAEQLMLAWPMKHLCSEECKGLCQRCGKDLNKGSCGCSEEHVDHRWEALKNFKVASK